MTPSALLIYGYAIDNDDLDILPWCVYDFRSSLTDWWIYINDMQFDSDIARQEWLNATLPCSVRLFGYDDSLGEIITSPNYAYEEVKWESKSIDLRPLITQPEDPKFNDFVAKYIPDLADRDPSWILASLHF